MAEMMTQGEINAANAAAIRAHPRTGAAGFHDVMLARSEDSASMVDYWNDVDTIIKGIKGFRAAGEAYLPRFNGEDASEYAFRLKMTKCSNVYRDIIEGLATKPFEEEIQLVQDESTPQQMTDFIKNVDGSSNSMNVFAGALFFNGINNALSWIFVDHDRRDPNIVSLEDAKKAGVKPYWSHILARNVLDVRSTVVNGNELITYFKIYEPGHPDHIRIFERSSNGVVSWTLYEKKDTVMQIDGGETYFHPVDGGELSIDEIPVIPFITGRRNGRSWEIFPAMQDAADLQIELYQQESGLKFAKNLTAYPMLAANGISPPKDASGKSDTSVAVGPNRVLWSSPGPDGTIGRWEYLEPTAESLKFLAEDVKDTIVQLRELGRQPLTAQSGNITVITAAVAAGKARSAVKQWAYMLKDCLENALKLTAKWMQIENFEPQVHVFVEFDDYTNGDDLDALNAARERGDISQETYLEEMRRRGWLSSNFTVERERQRLLDEVPGDDGVDNNGV